MLIVDLFQKIAVTSKTTEKMEMLRNFLYTPHDLYSPRDNDALEQTLKYIYSKEYRFDIKSTSVKLSRFGINKDFPYWLYIPIIGIKGRTRKIEFLQKELAPYTQGVCSWFLKGLDKDLGIGIKRKLINKVFQDLIPDFQVMLADRQNRERFEKVFLCPYVYINLKIDGIRCLVIVPEDGPVEFLSRAGLHISETLIILIRQEIERNINKFRGYVFDGEIYSNRFHKLQRLIMRKNLTSDTIGLRNSCRLALFDSIPYTDFMMGQTKGKVEIPLSIRIGKLNDIQDSSFNFIRVTKYNKIKTNYPYILKLMEYYLSKGYEGLMVKHPDSYYYFKRVSEWMKFKGKDNLDLEIIDTIEGEGKYVGSLGAIVVNFEGKSVKVGTGFTDEERKSLWNQRNKIVGRIAEITYREITHLGSLKDPRFECIRFDKGQIEDE